MQLSVAKASTMSGKAQTTIRAALQKGELTGGKDKRGRWSVDEQSLRQWLASDNRLSTTSLARSHISTNKVDNINQHLVEQLENRIQELQREKDEWLESFKEERQENRKLQSELLRITSEMKALLSREDKSLLSRWLRSS